MYVHFYDVDEGIYRLLPVCYVHIIVHVYTHIY